MKVGSFVEWLLHEDGEEEKKMPHPADGYLFVYGNLMRGFPKHHLLGNARLVGKGRTLHEWTLLALKREGAPAMKAGGQDEIVGEVYANFDHAKLLDSAIAPWMDYICIQVVVTDERAKDFWITADAYCLIDKEMALGATQIRSGDYRLWMGAKSVAMDQIPCGFRLRTVNDFPHSVFMRK